LIDWVIQFTCVCSLSSEFRAEQLIHK